CSSDLTSLTIQSEFASFLTSRHNAATIAIPSVEFTMSITIGKQLGSHEITALLGKGGMGEVYRARDTKLKREVAIKILPDEFSRDPDRVSRFQREAEVLASLNHQTLLLYTVLKRRTVRDSWCLSLWKA